MASDSPETSPAGVEGSRTWRRVLFALRLFVPFTALGVLLWVIPIEAVLSSMARTSPAAIASALLAVSVFTGIAVVRWRLLFAACGVAARPSLVSLYRIYWIGCFYNSYVPGGVGGDVLRGWATRHTVGERGLLASLAIVLLERLLGLTGLMILVDISLFVSPFTAVPGLFEWSLVGFAASVAVVVSIVNASRLAPHLPKALGRVAASVPQLVSLPHFLAALALSVVTQFGGVVAGHVLVASISGEPTFVESLAILPIVNASMYFPLTVGGAGLREAGFVILYGFVGVSQADALASSLMFAAVLYAFNAVGGVLHAVRPITLPTAAET